jgi:phosphatidylethanolamine/phosphatidyl-N-methylethanolamine N-methyltransferase
MTASTSNKPAAPPFRRNGAHPESDAHSPGGGEEEEDEGDTERRIPRAQYADLPGCLRFIWAGLAKNLQTGGIVPSQRFLIAKMIAPVPRDYQGRIFELGAGTGVLTLRLATRCPAARIVACELNPDLAEHSRRRMALASLQRRVSVFSGSAENLLATAAQQGWSKPDYIISGIPLGNLGRAQVLALITAVRRALAEGGLYIQFQHSLIDRKNLRACFGSLRTVPALWNFPPAVVYYARC